jgi:phospholipid/cholesterol/gamma-HCH transport system ATP-binding protein
VIDYVYFIAVGIVVAQGTTEEVKASNDPFVRQFVRALPDGPVPFHYKHEPYEKDLELVTPE